MVDTVRPIAAVRVAALHIGSHVSNRLHIVSFTKCFTTPETTVIIHNGLRVLLKIIIRSLKLYSKRVRFSASDRKSRN